MPSIWSLSRRTGSTGATDGSRSTKLSAVTVPPVVSHHIPLQPLRHKDSEKDSVHAVWLGNSATAV